MKNVSALARTFAGFGRSECSGYAPLYEALSRFVSLDQDLLEIASKSRKGQPAPNLLFGAVHYLLLKGAQHPLRKFYLAGDSGDPEIFKEFCLKHRNAIEKIIATRIVQTNEVGRSAALFAAFSFLKREYEISRLNLIEIGASAGLNLLWDKFRYDFGNLGAFGDRHSKVVLKCKPIGRPPLERDTPYVLERIGIDINPIDTKDRDSMMWLRALIWPGRPYRAMNLLNAARIRARIRPRLIKANVVDVLPKVFGRFSGSDSTCTFHSAMLYHLTLRDRRKLFKQFAALSRRQEFFEISHEDERKNRRPLLILRHWKKGKAESHLLAECHPHGMWIRWLIP